MAAEYKSEQELVEESESYFKEHFGLNAEVVAVAPGRVNLIGEHTDYNDGFVLPMAIPLCTVVVGRRSIDAEYCRVLTLTPQVDDPKEIDFPLPSEKTPLKPGRPKWANYIKGVVANFKGALEPFNVVINTSLPLGGGLSSSASLEVAMYGFLHAISPKPDQISLMEKAQACQKAEHDFPGMPCGIMDQFISFMGKKGHALLIDCRSLESQLVPLSDPDVSVLISNSNVRHELTGTEYSSRKELCQEASRIIGKTSLRDANETLLEVLKEIKNSEIYRRARHVVTEIQRTEDAAVALQNRNYKLFGELMYQSHLSLRDDYEVSCPEQDQLVDVAMSVPGVFGSRMTGGGFGGCTVTLLQSSAVDLAIQTMQERFTGNATFYVCSPADGAHTTNIL